MENNTYLIESSKPFSESLLWQFNRNFYQEKGPDAWREDLVPHHLTSNSMVGKTYAELIFAFLKDQATEKKTQEKVYILELGAGHGRLAFHILKHLEALTDRLDLNIPSFCYVLSDIVEENLDFFQNHHQFKAFFEKGMLDVTYFDAIDSEKIFLRHSKQEIFKGELTQPLLVIANYFFDSLPTDLFHVQDREVSTCSVKLESDQIPKGNNITELIEHLQLSFEDHPMQSPHYQKTIFNDILEEYKELVFDTYLFFPHRGLLCVETLRKFSPSGLMLLSMDKGFHEIHDLENAQNPEIIKHGSLSVWVNYHAFQAYCEKRGGTSYLPSSSTFYAQVCCLLLMPKGNLYPETGAAYQRFVNDFGPDDFNGLKRLAYQHLATMKLPEILSILRLSGYDYTMFKNFLPRIRQVSRQVTFNERYRLKQTMDKTWHMYFSLYEAMDLASEIGGIMYDLGYYQDSLQYFHYSNELYGHKPDVFYNRALCFYQLREDEQFLKTLKEGRGMFPNFQEFAHLDKLDLSAK